MKSNEIRKSFLEFFAEKKHTIVPSAPVVPFEDPTLLFTNAGMNQFKDVFLGNGKRDYTRATDTQKCIRAGGKHNDLEDVGKDGTHHTFFEMLGNWSFGDYYKKEAIEWAWELLTKVWKIDKSRLWVTVYKTDDEAYDIWINNTDVIKSHVLRFDEKDNFWEMGETGPCGPCSEIHYDFTENGCKADDVNAGIDDVMEIWNLVFIQYNRNSDGNLEPLPMKHIDTGMGFERVTRVLQNKTSNYDTDIFQPIIKKITEITGNKYEGEKISPMNAIADHIRTLTFAISDGAIPSNEGRGYVLRRILRRASRLARKLDYNEPVLYKLVDIVVEKFGDVFPEIVNKKEYAEKIIKAEEESFNLTLDKGIELFNDVYEKIKSNKDKIFPGKDAFKLYDTFGFPLDLTEVIAEEKGFKVDTKVFNEEMTKQKERARGARKETINSINRESVENLNVNYNPYDINSKGIETKIIGIDEVIYLETNPFYSESGGQISDTGRLILPDKTEIIITGSNKYGVMSKDKVNLHENDKVKAVIDFERRKRIERNHSATHIFHETLKRVLGEHIKQMGSLVSDEYLRFDFPHFQKVTDYEIAQIEDTVNNKIFENIKVNTLADIPIEEANKIPNVKKFFGEKYGEKVRVVIIDENFSVEFCGGTHIANTNEIGLFKIIKEESISSGVRRIVAVTGDKTKEYLENKNEEHKKIFSIWKDEIKNKINSEFTPDKISENLSNIEFTDSEKMKLISQSIITSGNLIREENKNLFEQNKLFQKEQMKKNLENIFTKLSELKINSISLNDKFNLIKSEFNISSKDEVKEIGDYLQNILKDYVVFLCLTSEDKVNMMLSIGDVVLSKFGLNAGKLLGEYAKKFGAGGGGKANIATAGLKNSDAKDEAMSGFDEFLKSKIL
ncbi:MAG TPA: alanine--tRNA ligase [Ignavibacteria bacterium]|nr:alanine--tRNA ligase [Ignavibacteria bacterium]